MSATKTLKIGLSDADKTTMKNQVYASAIATLITPYSSSSTYAVGDFCSKDGNVYKCTTAISTAEAWNSSHWASATLNDVVNAVNSAVAQVNGKANVDGNYPTMTVGLADNLNSKIMQNDVDAYNFRTAGGSKEIGNICKENAIVGGSLGFVQRLANNSVNVNSACTSQSYNSETKTYTYTATSIAYDAVGCYINTNVLTVNHRYFVSFKIKPSKIVSFQSQFGSSYLQFNSIPADKWKELCFVKSYNANNAITFYAKANSSGWEVGDSFGFKEIEAIDLDTTFGSVIADYILALETANAGDGIDWIKRHFKKPFYAQTTISSSPVCVITRGKQVTGFNHAKSFTNGSSANQYTDGLFVDIDDLLPNTSYCISCVAPSGYKAYPNENLFTNYTLLTGSSSGRVYVVVTTGSKIDKNQYVNGKGWLVFKNYSSSVVPNFSAVCVNYHYDGERDGEFEEYASVTTECDEVVLKGNPYVDEDGNLRFLGDRYNYDGSIERYILKTVPSEMSLSRISAEAPGGGTFYCFLYSRHSQYQAQRPQIQGVEDNTLMDSKLCFTNSFKLVKRNEIHLEDLTYCLQKDGQALIRDDSCETVEAFTTKYANTFFQFVYKESQEDTSATPYPLVQAVDNWGSEKYLEPLNDTRPCEVPVGHDTDYPLDCKSKIEIMPDLPTSDGVYVCKVDSGTAQYVSLPTYLSDNGYKQAKDLPTVEALGGTLRQLLAAKESLDFDNTGYVDLGSLSWSVYSGNANTRIASLDVNANRDFDSKYLSTNGYSIGYQEQIDTIYVNVGTSDTSVNPTGLLAYKKAE